MKKAELYKIFIKNKLIWLLAVYLLISFLFSFQFHINDMEKAFDMGAVSGASAIFLNRDNLNFFIIIILIYSASEIWINEYKSNMKIYSDTSKNGGTKLAVLKIVIIILVAVFCSLISDFFKYISYLNQVSDDSTLLASCGMDYAGASRQITAQTAVACSVAMHALGYSVFAVICSFFSVLLKSVIPLVGILLGIITIPTYLFSDLSDRVRIPAPTTLMSAGTMFRGNIMMSDDETKFVFKELTDGEIISDILTQSVVLIMLCVITICIFSGARIKRSTGISVFVILSLILTGCKTTDYKSTENNYFYIEGTEYIYSKSDNEIIEINATHFSDKNIVGVYGNYTLCYEDVRNTESTYQIKMVSLPDLTEHILLTIGKGVDIDGFLGLDSLISFPSELIYDEKYMLGRTFVFEDNKLYFFCNQSIAIYDIISGLWKTAQTESAYTHPSIQNGNIYYISDDGFLFKNNHKIFDYKIIDYIVNNDEICVCKTDKTICLADSNMLLKTDADLFSNFLYLNDNKLIYLTENGTSVIENGEQKDYNFFAINADEMYMYVFEDEVKRVRFD